MPSIGASSVCLFRRVLTFKEESGGLHWDGDTVCLQCVYKACLIHRRLSNRPEKRNSKSIKTCPIHQRLSNSLTTEIRCVYEAYLMKELENSFYNPKKVF